MVPRLPFRQIIQSHGDSLATCSGWVRVEVPVFQSSSVTCLDASLGCSEFGAVLGVSNLDSQRSFREADAVDGGVNEATLERCWESVLLR